MSSNQENKPQCSDCKKYTTYKDKRPSGELYDKWYTKDGKTLCKKCFVRIRYQERNAPPADARCSRCNSSTTTRSKYGAPRWHKSVYDQTKLVCSSCHVSEVNETRIVSDETRRKMSESLKGHVVSEEARRKQSETNKGKGNPFYGKKHSEESLKKMSEAHKKWLSENPHPNLGNHLSEESKNQMREKKKDIVNKSKISRLEGEVCEMLDVLNVVYKTHVPIKVGHHRYRQVDILIKDKLVIEVDGNRWHACPLYYGPKTVMFRNVTAEQIWARDKQETEEMEKQGYFVLRFWEWQIVDDIGKVARRTMHYLHMLGIPYVNPNENSPLDYQ